MLVYRTVTKLTDHGQLAIALEEPRPPQGPYVLDHWHLVSMKEDSYEWEGTGEKRIEITAWWLPIFSG